jgi:hypothetical protein
MLELTYRTDSPYFEDASLDIALRYLSIFEIPDRTFSAGIDQSAHVIADIAQMPKRGMGFPPDWNQKG